MLGAATVLVLPSRCAGAIVEAPWLVATAKHCIDDGVRLRVRVSGVERDAELVDEDAAADQVVLALASAVPVTPLGSFGTFRASARCSTFTATRSAHGGRRHGSIGSRRVRRCRTSRALHTSIDGTPGDSGAPLVDVRGEVVGLMHGGAKCRIATPGDRLARVIDRVLEREQTPAFIDRLETGLFRVVGMPDRSPKPQVELATLEHHLLRMD